MAVNVSKIQERAVSSVSLDTVSKILPNPGICIPYFRALYLLLPCQSFCRNEGIFKSIDRGFYNFINCSFSLSPVLVLFTVNPAADAQFNNPLFPKSVPLSIELPCACDWPVSLFSATAICGPNYRSTPVTSNVECESGSPDGASPVDAPLRGRLADCFGVQWREENSLAENAN